MLPMVGALKDDVASPMSPPMPPVSQALVDSLSKSFRMAKNDTRNVLRECASLKSAHAYAESRIVRGRRHHDKIAAALKTAQSIAFRAQDVPNL